MSEQSPQSEFKVFWTWSSPARGWLCTIVKSDGQVRQVRQYSPATEAAADNLGLVKGDRARRIYELAAAVFDAEKAGSPVVAPDNAKGGAEALELELSDEKGDRSFRVPLAELSQHPEMVRVREEIIRARNQIRGFSFLWYNVGARVGVVFLALFAFVIYLTVSGRFQLNKIQREAQKTSATVTAREGSDGYDKHKYLTVHLNPANGSNVRDVDISKYLSAENWNAAKPGSQVRIWYLPKTGAAYLEDDILRNVHDQSESSFLTLFPLGIAAIMIPLLWFLSRYRAGTHLDGKEYMIRGDRVVLDGKAMPFSNSELLALRALIRMAE